ncbi:hypothetical protein [Streptomyces sp. NPDC002265]|uniref:hypothetical protein n=1 Tax=Streptomyces sp. NPDC002265 TaxID=3154415 RepID=UPI003317ACFA
MRSTATLCPTLHWLKTEGPLSSEPPMVNGHTRRVPKATDAGRRAMKKNQQALRELARKVLGDDAPYETATDRHRPACNGLEILHPLRERGYKPGHLADHSARNTSEPED